MSDSQNKKNEQQNNLCTTLTEQWKKGKLPCGWYYIKIADIVFIDFFEGKVWKNKKDKYIDKVLAQVPSYEEWQRIFHYASKYEYEYTSCAMDYENLKQENQQLHKFLEEFNALEVAKENQQLKELLERASYCIIGYRHNDHLPERVFYEEEVSNLLEEIDEVLK